MLFSFKKEKEAELHLQRQKKIHVFLRGEGDEDADGTLDGDISKDLSAAGHEGGLLDGSGDVVQVEVHQVAHLVGCPLQVSFLVHEPRAFYIYIHLSVSHFQLVKKRMGRLTGGILVHLVRHTLR